MIRFHQMFATSHKKQCPPISPWTNVCDPSGLGSRHLTRRSALKLATGLVAAGWSPFGSRSAAADEATVFDCVVIGAGVAGLAAARKLHAANQRVVVLEARDRIGGRVWTDMSSPDGPIELGAQWVHGIHGNPLAKLCAQIGIQTFTTNYNSRIVIGADGRRWTEREADEREKQFKGVRREVHKLRKQLRANKVPDQPLGRVWSDVLASRTLNAADSERLAFEANIEIEHEYGADLSQLSLYEYDQDASEQGGDMVIPGGYAQIPASLARGLDIQLREVVQSVTVNANGVEVRTERGVFRGKCALVTLPLGVLQAGAVKFDPPLPEKKLAAIKRLGSGRLDKVCLRFPRTFWPETHLLNFAGSRTGEFAEWINAAAFLHAPVLYGYNTGTAAAHFETKPAAEVTAAAVSTLRTMFGRDVPEPQSAIVTQWGRDPYALGAYSHLPPGASAQDFSLLAEPVGRQLFFAGEATSLKQNATVHGALLSGEREADLILQR